MTPRERLFSLEQHGIKLGLDNITAILYALGRPDQAFPCVHVAGTNGKGSVTAMVERGLRAAGHRTGRYTSPHLFTVEERVAIDGAQVDSSLFDEVTADVLAVVDELLTTQVLSHVPTFFEVTTAIAFQIFRHTRVSAAVIEVGLGGRFDATNVITPRLTAITSIDFDHERHLGRTLQQIAFEKAGIIKPGIPVVVGDMPDEAHDVISRVAQDAGALLIEALPTEHGILVPLALSGVHQRFNAAVAIATLKLWGVTDRSALISALTDVDWPARLEWLHLANDCTLLLDAAHNPAGARALANYLLSEWSPLPLILGVMRDKEIDAMLSALGPAVSRVLSVTVDSPRALSARELAEHVRGRLPLTRCDTYDDVEDALASVCGQGARAVVAGSIFLVGPLRARLLARGATPVRYSSKATPYYLN